jgi:hypothetical protein
LSEINSRNQNSKTPPPITNTKYGLPCIPGICGIYQNIYILHIPKYADAQFPCVYLFMYLFCGTIPLSYPPVYFNSSLDYSNYLLQHQLYVNSYTVQYCLADIYKKRICVCRIHDVEIVNMESQLYVVKKNSRPGASGSCL